MKFLSIYLLALALNASANGFSQTVTLNEKAITYNDLFRMIHKQTGYQIFYKSDALNNHEKINVTAINASIDRVLNELLKNKQVQYSVLNKSIVIKSIPERILAFENARYLSIPESAFEIVKGTVTDEEGNPLADVSVLVIGTTKGTTTKSDGSFSIDVKAGESLAFSRIGYETVTVKPEFDTDLNIKMTRAEDIGDEVIVVGYGTQKKITSTGSVATISAKDIENRPVTNLSSALAGLAQGVNVQQGSGRPGEDGANFIIRGAGTLNNNSPLVVIDGIIGDMNTVNPNDVESISILKDASVTAVYGSQAANGVILITTKKGSKGKTSVNLSSMFSSVTPINLPEFVTDYATHMRVVNRSALNLGQAAPYADEVIATWETAKKDPNGLNENGVPNWLAYPNTDWAATVFENNLIQNHNVSVSGGSKTSLFNLSLGYLDNSGIMRNTGAKRYQLRANVQVKVANFLTVGTQTFGQFQSKGKGEEETAFTYLNQTVPGLYPYYEGRYGLASAQGENLNSNNILAILDRRGGRETDTRINTTLFANADLYKGLKLESRLNYQPRFREESGYSILTPRWDFAKSLADDVLQNNDPSNLSTANRFRKDYQLTFDNVLRYNTTINNTHSVGALIGYNEVYNNYYDFSASKRGLIDPTITTLSSAAELQAIEGTEYEYALRSWFGRLNYEYKSKYIFEASLRRDASSRFHPDYRIGYFPAFAGAWRISEEAFFKGLKNHVSELKLRGSYGTTGNNRIDNYEYQSTYGPVNYSFNNTVSNGLAQTALANPLLTWETAVSSNIAIDATMFNNRANFTIEWYDKTTRDILTRPAIPSIAGTAKAPRQNTATVSNSGIEFSLGWKDKIGAFSYGVNTNFAVNRNRVTKFNGALKEGWITNPDGSQTYTSNLADVSYEADGGRVLEGHLISEYYIQTVYRGSGNHFNADGSVNIKGGPKDGIIRTEEDLAWVNAMKDAGYKFAPLNTVGAGQLYRGDLIYADMNSDSIYGNNFDRTFTNSSAVPKYVMGLTLNAAYKGFDFSMVWAGNLGFQYVWRQDGYNTPVARLGWAVPALIAENSYYYNEADPNDPYNNINGTSPRMKYNSTAQNQEASNFWLYNGSYVKLKNLQVGYTLPQKITKRLPITKARIFFSGENLLLLTSYPGLDPEVGSNIEYPTLKQYAMGINIGF